MQYTFGIYFWLYLLCFNSLARWPHSLFLFSHSFSVCTVLSAALCFSSVSMDLLYCTLFALTSQSPAGKQCLVSLGSGTALQWSQA